MQESQRGINNRFYRTRGLKTAPQSYPQGVHKGPQYIKITELPVSVHSGPARGGGSYNGSVIDLDPSGRDNIPKVIHTLCTDSRGASKPVWWMDLNGRQRVTPVRATGRFSDPFRSVRGGAAPTREIQHTRFSAHQVLSPPGSQPTSFSMMEPEARAVPSTAGVRV